jgi:hypothetical protein
MNKLGHKKTMLYGLILAAAVIGLAIDRLRSEDSNAGAVVESVVSAKLNASAGSGGKTATADEKQVKGPDIARIFQGAASGEKAKPSSSLDPATVRDAFGLTAQMKQFYKQESQAKKEEEAKQAASEEELRRQQAEQFQSAHKLKGTSLRDNDAWALIDGRVVRVGEQIDGFELQRVERYRVYLQKDNINVILSLPMPF